MFRNFLFAILAMLPISANAHSPLSSSSPQNGESLDIPPTQIVMDFESPAKLIKVELTKSKVNQENSLLGGLFSGDDGEYVTLGKSFLMSRNKRQIVPLPSLGEGNYLLSWRAMGEDGHVMKGKLTFKVKDL